MGTNEESSRITSRRILHTEVERKSWNIQRLTSQVQELQEKDELFEWPWQISHLPSQPAGISKSALYATLQQTLATCHMNTIWITGNRFCKSTFDTWVITNTLSRNSSFCDTMCYRWDSGAHKHRDTCCKRGRTNWKHNSNVDDYEHLCSCGYPTEFYEWTAKRADSGTSIW